MKKALKVVAGILVVLVVLVLCLATFGINPIVKSGVEKVGPQITKTAVTLAKVAISPFSGKGELVGLVVGNPEGFKTASAMALGSLKVDIDTGSVMSDRVVIREIRIEGPEITYEVGLKGSNIGKLLENIEGEQPQESPEEEPEQEAGEPEKEGKKVQINDFIISGGKIRMSAVLMQGTAVTLPLPPIHLKDIGKEEDGATISEVVARVMKAIVKGVTETVAASGELIGKGAEAVGDAAMKGADVVGDAAMKGAGAVGGAAVKGAGAVGGAAVKGADAVGDAAKKGAGAVTGAAKKGVGGLVGGAKGLIQKDD